MSCLRQRVGELGALANVFAKADAGIVQKAIQASSSLTKIGICADEEALRAPYPPPKTAEDKAKVAAIREKLVDVVAFEKTGKYREGLDLARKLEEMAGAIDYRPVQAEVLLKLGILLESVGEYKSSETTLDAAARAAGESRYSLLAAKAMVLLVSVVGYRQARYKEGISIGRDAEVMLGVAGGNDSVRSSLLNNLGIVFRNKGDYDESLKYYRKSLDIDEKAQGPEHPGVVRSLNQYRRRVLFTGAIGRISRIPTQVTGYQYKGAGT